MDLSPPSMRRSGVGYAGMTEASSTTRTQKFKRGTLVEYWFDDGRGGSLLYGEVTAAGPKTASIRWESGLANRVKQDTHLVSIARDQAEAREAINSASKR